MGGTVQKRLFVQLVNWFALLHCEMAEIDPGNSGKTKRLGQVTFMVQLLSAYPFHMLMK